MWLISNHLINLPCRTSITLPPHQPENEVNVTNWPDYEESAVVVAKYDYRYTCPKYIISQIPGR